MPSHYYDFPKRLGFTVLTLCLAVGLCLTGCSPTATANHPGAVNAFDSQTYDVLLTAQAAIEAAKPLATTASTANALNAAIGVYNAAEAAYVAYHQAATAGTATASQQSALQSQVAALKSATAALPVAVAPPPSKVVAP